MSTVDIDVTQEAVTAGEVIIYSAPTASNFSSSKITGGQCTNASAVDTELTIWLVKFSDTTELTNQYFPPKVIFSGSYDLLSGVAGAGLTLKSGDFIVTQASIAGNLNVKLSIVEKYQN